MSTNSTPRPVGTVMLPAARLGQLRTLAGLREPPISVTELIEDLIGREVEAEVIPDELPGFTIGILPHREDLVVSFTMEQGFGYERMRSSDAVAIANVLDDVSTAGAARGKSIGTGDDQIRIVRVGRGVVIAGTEPHQRRSLTPRMACDLARQLRKAANLAIDATEAVKMHGSAA